MPPMDLRHTALPACCRNVELLLTETEIYVAWPEADLVSRERRTPESVKLNEDSIVPTPVRGGALDGDELPQIWTGMPGQLPA